MSQRKRFSFDDEVDDTIDLSKDDLKNSSIANNDKPSNDNVFADEDGLDAKAYPTDNGGDKSMKNKKKRKFVIYVFVAGGNDGPVYGDRCASLIAIDKSKFTGVEDAIKADPSVNSINIEVDCRIVKISMNFVDNTSSDTAKQLATNALHTLDDTLGENKEEGRAYSNLFTTANGRGQYNVEFVLTSNGDTNFPIFGTKHPNSDDITFTGANVVDQAATDRAANTNANQ